MPNYMVLPNEGLQDQLAYLLGKTSNGFADWELMVFSNNITPDQDTVYADLTEATFGGYSRETLTRSNWTSPTIIDDQAVSTWGTTPVQRTVTSSVQTVYGYAIVTPSSPVIRAIQLFDAPIVLVIGGILGILPRWVHTTKPPP